MNIPGRNCERKILLYNDESPRTANVPFYQGTTLNFTVVCDGEIVKPVGKE